VAWYTSNSDSKTHPVGQKKANELGIYDMSGNVCEWCNDWYGKYSNKIQADPQGPSVGSGRVLRGGEWGYGAIGCRVSGRLDGGPGIGGSNGGFRLVIVP